MDTKTQKPEFGCTKMISNPNQHSRGMTIAALAVFLFLGFQVLEDWFSAPTVSASQAQTSVRTEAALLTQAPISSPSPLPDRRSGIFRSPYDTFVVTQGLHGSSYGHMAVDIAAGKGAKIRSPINGAVIERSTDPYGNTTLILENQRFQVTMLHGDYTVNVGDTMEMGQVIGTESNHGYTTDMQGRSCAGRDCGYHTHLNVYDKKIGQNIDPLTLFAP